MTTKIRKQLEKVFEIFADLIYRNRIKTLVIILAITAALVLQLPRITFDLSTEGWLHETDPVRQGYRDFLRQFGNEDALIIGIKPPEVFDQDFLKKLKALHEELENNVPYIHDITSLVNARDTRGKGNELIVEELLENWPENDAQIAALKNRVLSNPMYQNILISDDTAITQILIRFDSRNKPDASDNMDGFEENTPDTASHSDTSQELPTISNEQCSEVVLASQKVLDKYKADDFLVYVTGGPGYVHYIAKGLSGDIIKFMIMAGFVIGFFLYIMFRRISGVIFPFIVVNSALGTTMGLMSIMGVPITFMSTVLPSFILAVGVGGSVHILAIFYLHYGQYGNKRDAIVHALGHSGIPVVMTNVTTACGLLSFATAELLPISDLGITAAIGVMLCLVFTTILLPALIAVFPIKHKPAGYNDNTSTAMGNMLTLIGNFATDHPGKILLICAALTGLSFFNMSKIIFSHDVLRWLPENSYIRFTTELLDKEMKGTVNLEIVVDTNKENGFYDPDLLKRVEEAKDHIETMTHKNVFVGKGLTLPMVLKEINQALNGNDPAHYTIPNDRDLVAQEFLLFENSGSDDLEDFTDINFTKSRITLKVPFLDSVQYSHFLDMLEAYLKEQFPNEKITMTGQSMMMAKTSTAAIMSMRRSYICALLVITILMVILIGHLRTGFLSMIPNIFPILLMLGGMGLCDLRMNAFTMLVGSIAIGLAVDDTIHFMHNFKKYYDETGDPKKAVHLTLQSAGRAMLVTTIVLSMGFFIYMFGTMKNTFDFGLLTGFAVLMALIADFFLAPALMVTTHKKKRL